MPIQLKINNLAATTKQALKDEPSLGEGWTLENNILLEWTWLNRHNLEAILELEAPEFAGRVKDIICWFGELPAKYIPKVILTPRQAREADYILEGNYTEVFDNGFDVTIKDGVFTAINESLVLRLKRNPAFSSRKVFDLSILKHKQGLALKYTEDELKSKKLKDVVRRFTPSYDPKRHTGIKWYKSLHD